MPNPDDPRLLLNTVLAKHEARAVSSEAATRVDGWAESIAAAFHQERSRGVSRPGVQDIDAEPLFHGQQQEIVIGPGRQLTPRLCPSRDSRSAYAKAPSAYVAFTRGDSTGQVHALQSTVMGDGPGAAIIPDTRPLFELTFRDVAARLVDVRAKVRCAHTTADREPGSAVQWN